VLARAAQQSVAPDGALRAPVSATEVEGARMPALRRAPAPQVNAVFDDTTTAWQSDE
jgi:hypothetical protein